MSEEIITTTPATEERETITFTHYETGEERVVEVPTKLQQMNQNFITAFITDKEHFQDIPWFVAIRDKAIEEVKAENPKEKSIGGLQIKAFPKIRIEFIKKYYPHLAPKVKEPKAKKPDKISIWEL